MREVLVKGLSPVEAVLREILPKALRRNGERKGSPLPPVHLAVLEACRDSRNRPFDDGSRLIGLTYQHVESAILDPHLISFNVREACLLKMPFELNDLMLAIERFPQGAVRLFRHPGINLLWHFKELVTSPQPRPSLKSALRYRIRADYPGMADQVACPALFVQNLATHIILSFYSGLAHNRAESLEGLITELARSYSNHVPKEAFLLQVESFFKTTEDVRRELALQEHYFGIMTEILTDLKVADKSLVEQFQQLHDILSRALQQLEAAGKAFLTNQAASKQVFEACLQAAQSLGNLLDDRDSLKRRIKP